MLSGEQRGDQRAGGQTHSGIRKGVPQSDGNRQTGRVSYEGAYHSQGKRYGVWIKEAAIIKSQSGRCAKHLSIVGEIHAADSSESWGKIGMSITINDTQPTNHFPLPTGPFSIRIEQPALTPEAPNVIKLQLIGTARANLYAFLGRKLEKALFVPKIWKQALQAYRPQRLNQRLCLHRVALDDEALLDFNSRPSSPQCFDFSTNGKSMGLNLVGWHTAELGVGESARSAAKALRASSIPHALVLLEAPCSAKKGDNSLSHLLQINNPYPVNVFHIDAPQSPDIDAAHGQAFRRGKYNIAYWAWELPEFPDSWIENFKYFNEVWAPSQFAREAIAAKSPLPVLTMPHCIDFPVPTKDYRTLLNLPSDRFLFCFAYDLNSHQSRKNPQAVIDAYRLAFLSGDRRNDAGLVVKTQSRDRNPKEYAQLLAATEGLPHCYLIDETLPRETVYGLMHTCDAYISLHRSEGFGLTVAESMFLGKPVISTNWSATSEFLDGQNGCPVGYRLVELEETFGPYAKGQIWADPIVEDAAQKMLKLVNDSDFAATIGQSAAKTIRARFSPQAVARSYENRLKAMRSWQLPRVQTLEEA